MSIKDLVLDFSDMSGGKNSAFPRHALAKNQVADTLNAVHEAIGTSRAPGYVGLASSAMFDHPIRGHFTYTHDDGTETMIVVSNKKIYTVNVATGAITEIGAGSLTADTECYAVNAAGKLWIVNGTDFVKVESNLSVYRVQIVAPAGTSAAAKAGGTLAAGVYGVYVSYARKDSAGLYLYSLPYSLGNVTLTGPGLNGTVTFAVPNSADPQVTHKVVFMTDADGSVPYYYGEVTNATATFDIASNAAENQNIVMDVVSASNQILPITPSAIFQFNDTLFVWDINTSNIYWSLKTDVNPFDMERFLAQNFRTTAFSINAMFSIGANLYLNHLGNGISTITNGDMSSVIKNTDRSHWFLDCKTPEGKSNIVMHRGSAFGLTNDGFRFYNGGNFSTNYVDNFSEDVSFQIRPDLDAIYLGIAGGHLPCAIVNRRAGKRTEYRFSYRNLAYGASYNNDQRVFNLDFYYDPQEPKKTWECWENGFAGMCIYGGAWYGAQSTATGQVVRESGASDINCFDRTGAFQTVKFVKQAYLLSRTVIDDLDAISVWGAVYALATAGGTINGNIILFDAQNSKYDFSIVGIAPTVALLPSQASGLGLALPFIMSPQYPVGTSNPMPFECRGNSVAIEISQVADDNDFFLYKVQLPRVKQIKNNMT